MGDRLDPRPLSGLAAIALLVAFAVYLGAFLHDSAAPSVVMGPGADGIPEAAPLRGRQEDAVRSAAERTSTCSVRSIELLVVDSQGECVDGALVRLTANGARIAVTTDSFGRARAQVEAEGSLDIAVHADGFAPVFQPGGIPPGTSFHEVRLGAGGVIAGRVVAASGPVAGVRVRAQVRGYALDFLHTDFIAGEEGDWATLDTVWASTDIEGRFSIRGLESVSKCAIWVDDDRWIAKPGAAVVAVGVLDAELEVHPATMLILDMFGLEAPAAECTVSIMVREQRGGESRSFSAPLRFPSTRLRFAAPGAWEGAIDYAVRVVGHADVAAAAAVRGSVRATARGVLVADGDSHAVHVIAQWPDGTLCSAGLRVAAQGGGGSSSLPAKQVRQGVYSVRVPSDTRALRLLAQDCLRDPRDAVPLDLVPGIGTYGVTMPGGADLVIVTAGGRRQSVVLHTRSGASVRIVEGLARFRGVPAGQVRATSSIGGAPVERVVEVGNAGEYRIDFNR